MRFLPIENLYIQETCLQSLWEARGISQESGGRVRGLLMGARPRGKEIKEKCVMTEVLFKLVIT